MIRFLKALVLVPLGLIVVLLAVANREPVALSLDPFGATGSGLSITVPLFLVIFAATILGVLIGGVGAWVAQGKHRKAARRNRREAEQLRAEGERLKNALASQSRALPGQNPSASNRAA